MIISIWLDTLVVVVVVSVRMFHGTFSIVVWNLSECSQACYLFDFVFKYCIVSHMIELIYSYGHCMGVMVDIEFVDMNKF